MVPEDKAVVAEDVGAAGDAPAQAMVKTQRPRIAYRMCCLPGGSFSDARLIKWLPTLRVVMFLNPIGAAGRPQRSSSTSYFFGDAKYFRRFAL